MVRPEPANRMRWDLGREEHDRTLEQWVRVLGCLVAPGLPPAVHALGPAMARLALHDARWRTCVRAAQLLLEFAGIVALLLPTTSRKAAMVTAVVVRVGALLVMLVSLELPAVLRRRILPTGRDIVATTTANAGETTACVSLAAVTTLIGMLGTVLYPLGLWWRATDGLAASAGRCLIVLTLTVLAHVVGLGVIELAAGQIRRYRERRSAVIGVAAPLVELLALPHAERVVADREGRRTAILLLERAATNAYLTGVALYSVEQCARAVATLRDWDLGDTDVDDAEIAAEELRFAAADLLLDVLRQPVAAVPRASRQVPQIPLSGRLLPPVAAVGVVVEAVRLSEWSAAALRSPAPFLFAGGCAAVAVLAVELSRISVPLRAYHHRSRLRRWFRLRLGHREGEAAEQRLEALLDGPSARRFPWRAPADVTASSALNLHPAELVAQVALVVDNALRQPEQHLALLRAFVPSSDLDATPPDDLAESATDRAWLAINLADLESWLVAGWRDSVQRTAWWLTGVAAVLAVHAGVTPRGARGTDIVVALVLGGFVAGICSVRLADSAGREEVRRADRHPHRPSHPAADRVTRRVDEMSELLKGPELVPYRGHLSWRVSASSVRLVFAAQAILEHGSVSLDVRGSATDSCAPFDLAVDGDGAHLRTLRTSVQAPIHGQPAYTTISFDSATLAADAQLWLELTQRGRFIALINVPLFPRGTDTSTPRPS